MTRDLDAAFGRLDAALDRLEADMARHFDTDARRSDLETELAVMGDDRLRLATELDSATARLGRVEAVHDHVGERVDAAIAAILDVLGDGASRPAPGG